MNDGVCCIVGRTQPWELETFKKIINRFWFCFFFLSLKGGYIQESPQDSYKERNFNLHHHYYRYDLTVGIGRKHAPSSLLMESLNSLKNAF